jgi:hypothetical protein
MERAAESGNAQIDTLMLDAFNADEEITASTLQ